MLLSMQNGGFYYQKDYFIFKNLSFDIRKEQSIAILGLNGRGKSTLLNCLMGISKLTEGKLITKATFAYLPQKINIAFDYNVQEVVTMGRARSISWFSKPSKEDIEISKQALDSLEILHLKDKTFRELSGGQKQLVLFARAIASRSEILFLDEPTSALDLKNQDKILNTILKLKNISKSSIVFTTHQPNHALAVADKTLILHNDTYCFDDSSRVLNDSNLSKLYDLYLKNINVDFGYFKCKNIVNSFSCLLNKN